MLEKIIEGKLNPIQSAAFLVSLRTKGETEQEILGFIQTMRKHMIKINAPKALDIVGTGGDGLGTFNISTAAALVVAGIGVPVAKHGNRAASSKCGSADVLESLGVNINLTPQQAEEVFKKVGMIFLFAPAFHPAMKQIGPIRKELGLRTIFNFLGPFLNPASTKRQLLGVPNEQIAKKLAGVATKLRFTHLLLVTSKDGMDEITTTSETKVFEVKGSKLNSYYISPKQFGIKMATKKDLLGKDPSDNAGIIQNILKGKKGPQRDIVVLNSAVAFYLSKKVKSIQQGIILAEESIDSGAAVKVLANLIKETNGHISFKERILNPKIGDIGLIAEIKLVSPIEGKLGEETDIPNRLKNYQNAGADAVSIITEKKIFQGHPDLVSAIKSSTINLPILQKDFIINEFQIEESRKIGADALLLIAGIVSGGVLKRFVSLCKEKGLEPVVEICSQDDLAKAVKSETDIIAVNARDLDTFEVNVNRACKILRKVPEKFIRLGFSGIHSRAEVAKYKQAGVKAVLVGTELMKTDDISKKIKELKNASFS